MKLLRPELASRSDLRARFDRDALAASSIVHDNVLRVDGPARDVGGFRIFTMELLVGVDLADALTLSMLPKSRALRIAIGAARGLHAAHLQQVIHRDVKPENLYLVQADDGSEVPKVLDFGAAQLGSVADGGGTGLRGIPIGTPEYTAPEQIAGEPGHPTADVYSLGILLYELIAGRVPFTGSTFGEIAEKQINQAPAPLWGISEQLDEVLGRALAKMPQARYQTMLEFEAALLGCLSALGS